jgi:hypothetical protein
LSGLTLESHPDKHNGAGGIRRLDKRTRDSLSRVASELIASRELLLSLLDWLPPPSQSNDSFHTDRLGMVQLLTVSSGLTRIEPVVVHPPPAPLLLLKPPPPLPNDTVVPPPPPSPAAREAYSTQLATNFDLYCFYDYFLTLCTSSYSFFLRFIGIH